jgi:hypothetical protein
VDGLRDFDGTGCHGPPHNGITPGTVPPSDPIAT